MYAQYVCVGYICPARVELQINIMKEIFRDLQMQESFLHINHSVGTIPTKCLIFIEIAGFVRTIPTKCLLFLKIAHFVRTIPTKCLIFIEIADFAGTIPANKL